MRQALITVHTPHLWDCEARKLSIISCMEIEMIFAEEISQAKKLFNFLNLPHRLLDQKITIHNKYRLFRKHLCEILEYFCVVRHVEKMTM